jgi:hypothetical protein
MSESGSGMAREAEGLRVLADLLCIWRLCGNARCRRAGSCRGRVHLCAKRNFTALPEGVRDFFLSFLAAKRAGLSFETFREEMEGREETEALFAWRAGARAARRRSAPLA